MLRLAEDRRSVNVVNDQYGSPTWAFDLANTIMFIIGRNADKEIHEIFNYSNDGIISWYEFANAIFKISGKTVRPYLSPRKNLDPKRPDQSTALSIKTK